MLARYHVVGAHGGAWIYEVDSHEEFERLLAIAPVFNFAHYDVRPLADMSESTHDVAWSRSSPASATSAPIATSSSASACASGAATSA